MMYYCVVRNADLNVRFGNINEIKRKTALVVFLQSLCLFSVVIKYRFCFFFIDNVLAIYILKTEDNTSL